MAVSEKFRLSVLAARLTGQRQYRLALAVGVDPAWLSKVMHGAVAVELNDQRLLKIGRELGLEPHEVFDGRGDDRDAPPRPMET